MSRPTTETGQRLFREYGPENDTIRADIIAIETEARATARKALSDRYDDLRWCMKDDHCVVLAEGLRLALADFDAAIRAREVAR